jgi:hypothetical protein
MKQWMAFLFLSLLSFNDAFGAAGHGGGGHGGGFAGRSPSMGRGGAMPHQAPRQNFQQFHPQANLTRQNYQDIQQRNQNNNVAANQSRQQIQQNFPNNRNWFGNQFDRNHNLDNRGINAWQGADWGAMNDWVSGDWSDPYYYDYPQQEQPIIVQNYTTNIPPPAASVAQPAQAAAPSQGSWLPIGVFAAAQDPAKAAFSSQFVQLALNKNGNVAGTYYNATTDQAHPLKGSMDKNAQVVEWTIADNTASPTMQTGLYNLSQETAPLQVHFPDDTTQIWYLVKLNEQQEDELQKKKLSKIN